MWIIVEKQLLIGAWVALSLITSMGQSGNMLIKTYEFTIDYNSSVLNLPTQPVYGDNFKFSDIWHEAMKQHLSMKCWRNTIAVIHYMAATVTASVQTLNVMHWLDSNARHYRQDIYMYSASAISYYINLNTTEL